MTAFDLLLASEAARAIACWCIVGGWLCGAGCVVAFGWRRLTRPGVERTLRLRLEESTAQLAHLYAANDKLARQLVEMVGRRATTRKGAA